MLVAGAGGQPAAVDHDQHRQPAVALRRGVDVQVQAVLVVHPRAVAAGQLRAPAAVAGGLPDPGPARRRLGRGPAQRARRRRRVGDAQPLVDALRRLALDQPPVGRHHQAAARRHQAIGRPGRRRRGRHQQSQSQQHRGEDARRSLHGNLLAADRTLTLKTDSVNISQNTPFLDTYRPPVTGGRSGLPQAAGARPAGQAGGQGAPISRSRSSPNGRSSSIGPTIPASQSSSARHPAGGGRPDSAAAW